MWRFTLLFVALLAACTEFPALDGKTSPAARAAPYPKLVPLDAILVPPDQPRLTPDDVSALQARVARLKRRAAALRRPVFDGDEKVQLQSAIGR